MSSPPNPECLDEEGLWKCHWEIPPADGPTSLGVCTACAEKKDFVNYPALKDAYRKNQRVFNQDKTRELEYIAMSEIWGSGTNHDGGGSR